MVALVVSVLVAQPFVRTLSSDEPHAPCLWWQGPVLEFRQGSTGNPTTGPSALTAVSAAFLSWNDAMQCSMLNIYEGPRSASRRLGASAAGPNVNLVLFRARSCSKTVAATHACWKDGTCGNTFDCWDQATALLGVTTVSFDAQTGRVFDADIEFNGADHVFTTVDSPVCQPGNVSTRCVASDVQNTATHEVGHFLGLGHTGANSSVMNDRSSMGERTKRSIDPGTRSFLCEAYSPGFGPDDCVTPPVSDTLGPAATQGCSSTGLGLAPLAALLVLWRRRAWRFALAALFAPMIASATTVKALSLTELIDDSSAIVRVRVASSSARWTDDGARIVTEVNVTVLDAWKGGRRELTVLLPGGVVGRVGQRVEGTPRLMVGHEYVLFLEARGDVFVPTGFHQGVFGVDLRGGLEPHVAQRSAEALTLGADGRPIDQALQIMPLTTLRRLVLERLVPTQGADSNRALPLALPTQISR